MLDPHFVILGAVISLIGTSNYILNTLRGKTHPNRVTWFLWALAPLIAFWAELDKGVGWQALMTFIVGFAPLLVFISSFVNKKSIWKITNFDLVCGALSLLGIFFWIITREGNIAILFAILADGLAALPTVVKAYNYPETESWLVFLGGATNATITMLTIDTWNFAHYGFPLYILSICLILVALIKFKLGARFKMMVATSK